MHLKNVSSKPSLNLSLKWTSAVHVCIISLSGHRLPRRDSVASVQVQL